MAYGARLESVLGESPRGFESPILRVIGKYKLGSRPMTTVASKKSEVTKIALSSGASSSTSAGHFYWHYRNFSAPLQVNTPGGSWLLGSGGLDNRRGVAVLSPRAHGRRFRVGLRTVVDYNFRGVRVSLAKLLKNQTGFVYIYEGSLADLCLTLYLAPRIRETTFFFNFFWPRHWSHFFSEHEWLWRLMRRVLHASASNIIFLADTPKYANVMSRVTGLTIEPFPVFSPFRFFRTQPFPDRHIDLFISFKRPEEWAFAQSVLLEFSREKSLKVVVTGPDAVLESHPLQGLGENINVEIVSMEMDEDYYVDLLTSTKLVFLPYLKEHYALGSSGKLVDACQAGCSVLVPENSGLSSQLEGMDPKTWATFSRTEPAHAALSIFRLLGASPKPKQRLRNIEQALSELEVRHKTRVFEAPTTTSHPEKRWVWLAGLATGCGFTLATYWEPANIRTRVAKTVDRLLRFFKK